MASIPSTLDECFSALNSTLKAEDIKYIQEMDQADLCRLHHGLGRWIRNNWKLWENGPLTEYFHKVGIQHPDDMSGIIIESFWYHLKGEPLKLDRQIKKYQDFWKEKT